MNGALFMLNVGILYIPYIECLCIIYRKTNIASNMVRIKDEHTFLIGSSIVI